MPFYLLKMTPQEAVHILRAETECALGAPELNTSAEKEYEIEEDFDFGAYGLDHGGDSILVRSMATLNIEPRVERNYWVLEVTVARTLGLLPVARESDFSHTELSLAEFEAELQSAGAKRTAVRLIVETPEAKKHFDDWLAEMNRKHSTGADPVPVAGHESPASHPATSDADPAEETRWLYNAREVVTVFSNPVDLEMAVEELEISGFRRAAMSVLGTGPDAQARVKGFYHRIETGRGNDVRHTASLSRDARVEGEAAAIARPAYIGGVAGTWAAIAAGSALAPAFAAVIAAGAGGAGLGALLAGAVARRYSERIGEQLARGGVALWVNAKDDAAEKRALDILEKMGGMHVHPHAVQCEWNIRDIPFVESG